MTIYLSNRDLQPTGHEPEEFIEVPAMTDGGTGGAPVLDRAEKPRERLSDETRIDITRRAQEYISGVVRSYHGDREDVRSVIHHLYTQSTRSDFDGGL